MEHSLETALENSEAAPGAIQAAVEDATSNALMSATAHVVDDVDEALEGLRKEKQALEEARQNNRAPFHSNISNTLTS